MFMTRQATMMWMSEEDSNSKSEYITERHIQTVLQEKNAFKKMLCYPESICISPYEQTLKCKTLSNFVIKFYKKISVPSVVGATDIKKNKVRMGWCQFCRLAISLKQE